MIAVFGGDLALKKENDNFNFFISQLRIRIEMAFGLMTRKWGILQHPLTIMMPHIPPLICCIAWLHNYCIDERQSSSNSNKTIDMTDTLCSTQIAYMRAAAEAEHRSILREEYPQWSLMRQEIVNIVKNSGFERPLANSLKRK